MNTQLPGLRPLFLVTLESEIPVFSVLPDEKLSHPDEKLSQMGQSHGQNCPKWDSFSSMPATDVPVSYVVDCACSYGSGLLEGCTAVFRECIVRRTVFIDIWPEY